MTVTTKMERITPLIATNLLKKNTHNRKVTQSRVVSHTAAMKDGTFLDDGQPIRIAKDGTLLDGQHRLLAVVASGIPREFVVVRGLEPEAQFVMDTGIKRSLSDTLEAVYKEPYAKVLASIIIVAHKWEVYDIRTRNLFSGSPMSKQIGIPEYISFFEVNKDALREAAAAAAKIYANTPITPRVAGMSYYLFAEIDKTDADVFFDRLRDASQLAPKDPILQLRQRFFNLKAEDQRGHGKTTPYVTFGLLLKAWNFYRQGIEPGNLKFTPGGAKPEALPELV